MQPELLARRVAEVHARIEDAQRRAGRTDSVALVAVTKTHPVATVRAAIEAGLRDVGENRVREMEDKVAAVGRRAAVWHLIGHLQRNKIARAVPLFDLLHSLDSLRLAEALSATAVATGGEVRALVQVNASAEASKSGFAAAEALEALRRICDLPGLRVQGLMTMAPLSGDVGVLRATFRTARQLWERAAAEVPGFTAMHLSMGMSNDYEIAVEEGSTLVRLGSILFGERG